MVYGCPLYTVVTSSYLKRILNSNKKARQEKNGIYFDRILSRIGKKGKKTYFIYGSWFCANC